MQLAKTRAELDPLRRVFLFPVHFRYRDRAQGLACYAGFRPLDQPLSHIGCANPVPGGWELQGYLRYRHFYRGTGKPVTPATPTDQQRREAEQREHEATSRALQNSIDMNKLFSQP